MSRVQLVPSHFDRLDPVARIIRWWTTQMIDLVGQPRHKVVPAHLVEERKGRLPRHIVIELGETDGFIARISLPKGHADAHRQAIQLRVPDLAPTASDQLLITAVAAAGEENGAMSYQIAMARRDRLNQLEAAAQRKGARTVRFSIEGEPALEFVSPRDHRRARSAILLDAGIVLGLVVAATIAVSVWTLRLSVEAETLAQQESSLRRAAVAAEAARQQGEISRELVERGLLTRRSAVLLDALAKLNTATPAGTWWTRVKWTPAEIAIAGQSRNATETISALSKVAKDWSVELAGPLAAAPAGAAQVFEIVARPRGASAP